jgi:hypothetical protein
MQATSGQIHVQVKHYGQQVPFDVSYEAPSLHRITTRLPNPYLLGVLFTLPSLDR